MTPHISFAITTKNEGNYIRTLLNQLIPHCQLTGNEIVIVDDYSDDELTKDILVETLAKAAKEGSNLNIKLSYHHLNNDFAAHKNYLNSLCTGKYIFQVDADETLSDTLLESLESLLSMNDTIDLFYIPRVNIVNGLTDEDIRRWGWRVNHKGHVMWPDPQGRLYRNHPDIKWQGKVHERIVGYKTMAPLPADEDWALYHIKEIERQRKQNNFYSTL
jgi:glycosyltransferase involved in cell wall biosynthesis